MAETHLGRADRVATIAGAHAAEVDRDARFPHEAIAALKAERLLGAAAPVADGGLGLTMTELVTVCQRLGQACASTAMIFAMHQIQLACLVRHGRGVPFFDAYVRQLCAEQRLIASVTSEVGTGGDLRSSKCAVELDGTTFTLRKEATTISYGEHADELLVTCRRAASAPASDQAIVLVRRGEFQLERTSTWDTLGMRGTCSPGFVLTATGAAEQILSAPFADIAARTMVPYSHILWSGTWLGNATDAVSRARAFVRTAARQNPGTTPPGALRVAEVAALLQTMRAQVLEVVEECDRLMATGQAGDESLSTVGFALKMNNLKITSSQQVTEICGKALGVCGMAGYKTDSKFSIGRHLRDAHSAALMISNDRIYQTNASLMLVHKDA